MPAHLAHIATSTLASTPQPPNPAHLHIGMNQPNASKPTFGSYNPALGKRKGPSASPGVSAVKTEPGVKVESGVKVEGGDAKRAKSMCHAFKYRSCGSWNTCFGTGPGWEAGCWAYRGAGKPEVSRVLSLIPAIPTRPLTSSHGNFRDPRTAAATVRAHLRVSLHSLFIKVFMSPLPGLSAWICPD